MAAASDEEDANYWPGFVDALSTMTMMLIFLMLILSLVIISVSQNVSRTQLMTIAKAAGIEVTGRPATIETLTSQIVVALATLSSDKTAPNQIIEQPASQTPTVDQHAVLAPSVEPATPQTATRNPAVRIVSSRPADLVSIDRQAFAQDGEGMITLVFPPRALKFDDLAAKKLSEFINGAGVRGKPMKIRALANVNSGNVTEARRFAYYRAMVVRQFLASNKISNSMIVVSVQDADSADFEDQVQLSIN